MIANWCTLPCVITNHVHKRERVSVRAPAKPFKVGPRTLLRTLFDCRPKTCPHAMPPLQAYVPPPALPFPSICQSKGAGLIDKRLVDCCVNVSSTHAHATTGLASITLHIMYILILNCNWPAEPAKCGAVYRRVYSENFARVLNVFTHTRTRTHVHTHI